MSILPLLQVDPARQPSSSPHTTTSSSPQSRAPGERPAKAHRWVATDSPEEDRPGRTDGHPVLLQHLHGVPAGLPFSLAAAATARLD